MQISQRVWVTGRGGGVLVRIDTEDAVLPYCIKFDSDRNGRLYDTVWAGRDETFAEGSPEAAKARLDMLIGNMDLNDLTKEDYAILAAEFARRAQ